MMECPTCFQRIIVPQSPASDDVQLIITGQKATRRPVPTTMPNLRTPPAPTSPAKNSLVPGIAFVVLLCAVIVVAFVFRGKIFHSTNTQGTTPSQTNLPAQNKTPVPQPVVVAPPANDMNWTLNLDAAAIPNTPAMGRIHGKDFICQRVYLDAGALTMRTANNGPPDLGLSVYLHANQSQELAGQTISISSDSTNAPIIRLRWKDDQQQSMTKDFKAGYVLRVEFGRWGGKRLPGKFYLAVPDEMKSYVAGTFNAEIRKPKPPQ